MNHQNLPLGARRRPSLRVAGVAGVAAICVVGVAACGGGDDEASSSTTTIATATTSTTVPEATTTTAGPTTSTSTTTTTTTTTIPRQPLTGEPLDDAAEVVDRPALAVKIDNSPAARRNHSGLAVADIVFEEIVEGNITRFVAVFHTEGSDPVGPIRSGRTQDVGILTSFRQPLFAWSGGNPAVTRIIADSSLVDLNWSRGGEGYYRGPGSAPNNLYNSTERLWSQTPDDHPGAPPQQYAYLPPDEQFTGEPVESVALMVGGISVDWEWDTDEERFLRRQRGSEHIDVVNGQIYATNVVVMGVDYRPSAADARSPEAQTVGEGPAFVFSNGSVVEARWQRSSIDEPLAFVTEDGDPVGLAPGNTWIELTESSGSGDGPNRGVPMEIQPG